VILNPLSRQQGLTLVDTVITLCLAGILLGVVIPKYQRVVKGAREAAVKAELANIRTSINLFKLTIQRNPESLSEMLEKKVLLPGRTGADEYSGSIYDQKYLQVHMVDDKGNILDAFENPFAYDPVRGEVKSTTEGYDAW
jgi:Tfp pilus assembly protein PilE